MTADEPIEKVVCPKCHGEMIFVTAVPHRSAPQMQQTIFVCYPCNRTWSYALSSEMAANYATKDSEAMAQSASGEEAAH
jgi:transposase-like protein